MKKIAYLILSASLFIYGCNSKEEKKTKIAKAEVPVNNLNGLTIVYYSNDSIKENFLFYKQQDAIVTKNQQNFQAELQRRSNEFQQYVKRNSEKEKSGLLSQNEVVQFQQKAQQMEQAIVQYQQEQGAKIEDETMKKLEEISKKIQVLGKKYCELNNIDIMLIYGEGGQINYIKPTMDVTKEFITFLNENQASIEKDLKK